jgi:hypothetical protein
MPEFDIKAASPDTSLPSTGFLFGADSQASANPSIYSVATTITALLGNAASADLLSFNSDAIFGRRAAANLRLGNADAAAPVAQTLSVQSVVTGTSNTAGQEFRIDGSQGTGTGAGGSLVFRVAPAGSSGSAQNALASVWQISGAGHFLAGADNTYDIGVFNGNRPRYGYFGSGVAVYGSSAGVMMLQGGDGVLRLLNYSNNNFDRVQFGGSTSSFPALKRSSAILQARLADDSAYTTIDAEHRLQGTVPATASSTGTAGDIRYASGFIYVCTATNTWQRAAIATW